MGLGTGARRWLTRPPHPTHMCLPAGSPRASLLPPTWPSSGADGGSLSPGAGMRPTPSPTRFAAGQYPGLPGGGGFESSAGSLVGAAMTGAPDVVLMQRLPDGSYVRHSYTPVPAAALHLMGLGPSSPPPPGSGSPMGAAGSAAPGYAAYMQQGPPQPPQLQRQPSLAQALGSFAQPPSQGWASPGRTSAAPSSFGMDGWGGAGEAGQPLAGGCDSPHVALGAQQPAFWLGQAGLQPATRSQTTCAQA